MAKANKAKVQEFRSMDIDTLNAKIYEEEVSLQRLMFSHAVNPIENPLTIRHSRRTIARMKTEQRRRALGF